MKLILFLLLISACAFQNNTMQEPCGQYPSLEQRKLAGFALVRLSNNPKKESKSRIKSLEGLSTLRNNASESPSNYFADNSGSDGDFLFLDPELIAILESLPPASGSPFLPRSTTPKN